MRINNNAGMRDETGKLGMTTHVKSRQNNNEIAHRYRKK